MSVGVRRGGTNPSPSVQQGLGNMGIHCFLPFSYEQKESIGNSLVPDKKLPLVPMPRTHKSCCVNTDSTFV